MAAKRQPTNEQPNIIALNARLFLSLFTALSHLFDKVLDRSANGSQPANSQPANDHAANDWAANDWAANDRAANSRTANDRTANDWTANDQTTNDWAANDYAVNIRANNRTTTEQRTAERHSAECLPVFASSSSHFYFILFAAGLDHFADNPDHHR